MRPHTCLALKIPTRSVVLSEPGKAYRRAIGGRLTVALRRIRIVQLEPMVARLRRRRIGSLSRISHGKQLIGSATSRRNSKLTPRCREIAVFPKNTAASANSSALRSITEVISRGAISTEQYGQGPLIHDKRGRPAIRPPRRSSSLSLAILLFTDLFQPSHGIAIELFCYGNMRH